MKKKILFAATSEGIQAGASRCYLNIVEEFKKREIDFVCLLPREGLMSQELKKLGIKYYTVYDFNGVWQVDNDFQMNFVNYLKYVVKSFYNFFAVNRVKKIIINEKIDIVHINSISRNVAALAARKADVPYVWHIRELLEEGLSSKFIDEKKARNLLQGASRVLCISKTVEDYYQRKYNLKNTAIIYDGIDINKFYSDRDIFHCKKIRIGIIGRVEEQKRQHILIKAFARLSDSFDNIYCELVGDYKKDDYYNSLIKIVSDFGISEMISFTGFVNNPQDYLKTYDIVCVCSYAEAFGLTTIEGMLSGALVVASDSGCNSELMRAGINGLLYKCDDIDDLYEKLKYAIKDVNKSRIIAKYGQKFAVDFSLDKNVNNILNCYEEIN